MAVTSAIPREISFFEETTFGTGPADWAADGTPIYAIEPDVSAVAQAVVANENNRLSPLDYHKDIMSLKNTEASLGMYLHGSASNAAEGAAAVAFPLTTWIRAALGGRDLGWAAGVVSSGAEASDEIEIGADPGFAVGDFVFAKDTSTGEGQFYRILAIAAGPPITLTLDRDLHFVPDVGGADTIHAVIDCYPHESVITNHDHANHKTLSVLVQGEDSEDVYVLRGCKPSLEIEGITAGEPTKAMFNLMVTTFDMEGATQATLTGTPAGEPGSVPGIGDDTLFLMSDAGGAMASVPVRGTLTAGVGLAYDRVSGPNGLEGVHGHTANLEQTTLEVMVPFDNAYNTQFRAQTEKQVLFQIGTGPNAWGMYWPQLHYAAEPVRTDETGLTTSQLSFKARLNQASPGALTGDNLAKWKSPFHILFVA